MSLNDELPTKHIVFSRINTGLHNEIADQTARFLRAGGKIRSCAIGETADFQTINARAEAVKRGGQNGANTTRLTARLRRGENGSND